MAAWGRFIVHVALPPCTAPLPLGLPFSRAHIRSSSKSKRIMPDELLHWWWSAPPVAVNCHSGVTPTPSQPQGVDDGGAGEATVAGRSTDTRIMNSFIVSATVDECVYSCAPRWHISVWCIRAGAATWSEGVGLCGWSGMWRRRRERRRRERTGAEAGRMLRCVWVRLSTTQLRRRRGTWRGVAQRQAWCRQRGAGAAGQRGGWRRQPEPRGYSCPTCVFSSGVRSSCNEGPSPWPDDAVTRLACNRPFRNRLSSICLKCD